MLFSLNVSSLNALKNRLSTDKNNTVYQVSEPSPFPVSTPRRPPMAIACCNTDPRVPFSLCNNRLLALLLQEAQNGPNATCAHATLWISNPHRLILGTHLLSEL